MPRPCKSTFDLLTVKVVSESPSRVTWVYLCSNFSLTRPLCYRLSPDVRVHTAIPTPVIPTPAIPNPNPNPNPIVSIASVGKAGVGKAGAPRFALQRNNLYL